MFSRNIDNFVSVWYQDISHVHAFLFITLGPILQKSEQNLNFFVTHSLMRTNSIPTYKNSKLTAKNNFFLHLTSLYRHTKLQFYPQLGHFLLVHHQNQYYGLKNSDGSVFYTSLATGFFCV